jgi:predicted HNH restriction endonuclease
LLRFLRRRRPDPIESAIEGILTESRRTNRSRDRRLRNEALRRSLGAVRSLRDRLLAIRGVDGRRVLTVHHRKQLSAFDEPVETTVDDLAVLGANCHLLIDSDPNAAMPVEDLRKLLQPRSRRS